MRLFGRKFKSWEHVIQRLEEGVHLPNTSVLTRSKAFARLTEMAFSVCDNERNGRIGKSDFFAGVLLVHMELAKHAGAAACFPPTREVVDKLFDACDSDSNGELDIAEFRRALVISCAQIASRMTVYFSLMVLVVPLAARRIIRVLLSIDQWMAFASQARSVPIFQWIENLLTWGDFTEKAVSLVISFLLLPMILNFIDRSSREAAKEKWLEDN